MEEYPNLLNDTLSATVPCAYWAPENVARATSAFQRVCPQTFVIENVKPLPSSHKPYCRWFVEFKTSNCHLLPPPGDKLKNCFKEIMKYKPLNSNIISRHPINAYTLALIYAREPCPCEQPLDFDMATEKPTLWPLEKEEKYKEEVFH